jgi:5-methylcytosine-specific restriction endonuclease McrA
MNPYSLSHVTDRVLLHDLNSLVAQERTTMAAVLAHIAEVDVRRLYVPAGHPSMYAYCVEKLGLSEDAAYKRIQAARAARQFPAIFAAVAEGRLHLTGLGLLVPYLTGANAGELLAAAAHKSKSDIDQLLAQRFPRTELLPLVQVIPASSSLMNAQLAPAQVEAEGPVHVRSMSGELAPAQVESSAPATRSLVKPHSPDRFALQFVVARSTYDKLLRVQALMSHRLPSGDIAQVFDRALDALASQLEKQKFAATAKPRARSCRSSTNARHVPARVKRAVWRRDQGQCTFVSEEGQRCRSRRFLEFDHIDPVARGGEATVDSMRLRCRAHNQFEAECAFGAGFMSEKRDEARRAAVEARAMAAAQLKRPSCSATGVRT